MKIAFMMTEEVKGEIMEREFRFDLEDAKKVMVTFLNKSWYKHPDTQIREHGNGFTCERLVTRTFKTNTGFVANELHLETRELFLTGIEIK